VALTGTDDIDDSSVGTF